MARAGEAEVVVTIGRIVHWVTLDGEVIPGIITRVRNAESGLVDLQVFHFNRGVELAQMASQGDGQEPGTWFWPPHVH